MDNKIKKCSYLIEDTIYYLEQDSIYYCNSLLIKELIFLASLDPQMLDGC